MVSSRLISGVVLLGVLAAAPTLAADGQRRRSGGDSGDGRAEEQGQQAGRAVPRSRAAAPQGGSRAQAQQAQVQRQYQASPQVQRQYQAAPQVQAQRQYRSDQNDYRGDGRAYAVPREYQRPYYPSYSYSNKGRYGYGYGYGYGPRTVVVPRYITPHFVTVVPYRPVRLSSEHRHRRLLWQRRFVSIRLHAARVLRSHRWPAVWRSAHHRLLSDRAGFRRRLLRRHRERLRRRVPAPESRGWSSPDRDPGTRARAHRVRRDGAGRADGHIPS